MKDWKSHHIDLSKVIIFQMVLGINLGEPV